MEQKELNKILEKHLKWLRDEKGGERYVCEFCADLTGADLTGANLDFSCWPLWCGSKNVKVDARIAAQLAAHFCVLDCDDPAYKAARKAILKFAKTSHRADYLGLLEMEKQK
jgi:hypothetical protein